MRKKEIAVSLILICTVLTGCKEQVSIQESPFEALPVIYGIIDPLDSIHFIRVERMYSGEEPPEITAKNPDSLFFANVQVSVHLTTYSDSVLSPIIAEWTPSSDKEIGFFSSQNNGLYSFKKCLQSQGYNLFRKITVLVTIPGLPAASATCAIINIPKIWSPHLNQQFLYIAKDNPIRIIWSGGFWNEADIGFEIREQYADSAGVRFMHFQKINDVQINGKYYEIKIPYEFVVQGICRQFQPDSKIIRRSFGPVSITIHTGQEEYARYIEFMGGINDFNHNPFTNIQNGLGLLSSKSTVRIEKIELDQFSRLLFANDPSLKELGFLEF